MPQQIRQAAFQRLKVLLVQLGLGRAAVVLESPDRGHHYDGRGAQPGHAALYIEKLLRAQVRAEARLRDGVFAQAQGHARRRDAVAAVGDVRKGAAVYEGRGTLQRLDQVGLYRVL